MQLTAFQSGKGDCLLLSNGTANILVDGGMPAAYRDHVANTLGRLRTSGRSLDLVYVSHIDQDHIGGVLRMLDDEVAWRVHDFQTSHGNPSHRAPEAVRPPKVRAIWHNAFHLQVKENSGPIEDALGAVAPVLMGASSPMMRAAGLAQAELSTSIREAIQVSRRISPTQLRIPLNPQAQGKLMMLRPGQAPVTVGGMRVTILGPTAKHLKRLREDWNDWLRANQAAIKTIRQRARADEERLGANDLDRLNLALSLAAEAFGNPESVTPPNLASLTLLVEQDAQSLLLTGDARGDQILDGLQATGRLTAGQPFRVSVLKVPHHGSENNIDRDFCDAVVADDYVFCGNGEHENPDLRVVELMAKRRLAAAVGTRFKFWFNSSEAVSEKPAAASHMAEVQQLVRQLAKSSQGRMAFKFLESGSSVRIL